MAQQYQVLARKYRPKNFHELIGQDHVSHALINAIDYGRLHHAYLFTGTRGVGKTTIARILAKCLNCDKGVTSKPCGVCENCVAIDQGRFIDLIEIDAASRTKVEDTRELLDNVPYAPTQGRYKVYLIDEVHMLSTHSFNALLKTLEEPPEHVKFLLATTDPQKLPITIISRCLQFVLRPLSQVLLAEHLANILTQENVSYTDPALWQLANAAKGSVRDALSLTDQAIAFGQGKLTDETVNSMLGLINTADLVSLLSDIYDNDRSAVAAQIQQMRLQMVDASSMFDGLAELLHQMALVQLLPEVALGINESQAQAITKLAQRISPEVLQLYYEIVIQARESIKLANTPMQSLEMCLLRLLAFRPLAANEIVNQPTPPISPDGASMPADSNANALDNIDKSKKFASDESNDSDESNEASNIKAQISPNLTPEVNEGNHSSINNNTAASDTGPAPQLVVNNEVGKYQTASTTNQINVDGSDTIESSINSTNSDSIDSTAKADSLVSNAPNIESQSQNITTASVITAQVDASLANDHIDTDIHYNDADQAYDGDQYDNDYGSEYGSDNAVMSFESPDHSSTTHSADVTDRTEFRANVSADMSVNDVVDTGAHNNAHKDAELTLDPIGQLQASSAHLQTTPIDSVIESADSAQSNDAHQSADSAQSNDAHQSGDSTDSVSILIDDPRHLLRCPEQSLTGEWTVAKWDYWLQSARENQQLDQDELALARQGLMTGQCNGVSTFVTALDRLHIQNTFDQLSAKLRQQFPEATITLDVDRDIVQEDQAKTPESRQKQRMMQATHAATEKLRQSPVMQYLSSRGQGVMGKVKIFES